MTGREKLTGPPDTARSTNGGAESLVVRVTLGGDIQLGDEPDRLLTSAMVAERLGIKRETWRTMVKRNIAPPADDPGDPDVIPTKRTPKWKTSTIVAFEASRRLRRKIVPFSGELR